jgi:hypothetical protein
VLPRLHSDVAARLAPDGAPWPMVFLHLVAEAARFGARTLMRLRQTEAADLSPAADQDRRSRLPVALDFLLRYPALTAPALARQLEITPQAALRILSSLAAAGVADDITRRKASECLGFRVVKATANEAVDCHRPETASH